VKDILVCSAEYGELRFRVAFAVVLPKVKKYKYNIAKAKYNKETIHVILQNEMLFSEELEVKKQQREFENYRILETLTAQINIKSIDAVAFALSRELLFVAKGSKLYKDNSDFIKKIIDIAVKGSQNNREFIGKIANILVYLELSNAKVFHGRIYSEYYSPEILIELSPEDKLPEIFEDGTEEQKSHASMYIIARTRQLIRELAEIISVSSNPTLTRPAMVSYNKVVNLAIKDYDKNTCLKIFRKSNWYHVK
jgi:hypothetical protein